MNLLTYIFARAGGGGSSGGGGGAGIIVLPVVIVMAIVAWWRRREQIKKAEQELERAEVADPSWDTAVERAKQVFDQFQADWSNFNVANMKNYLTPQYFEHISLMMEALKQMNRKNQMSNVRLTSAIIFNVSDNEDNSQDSFDIEMKASANDKLIDLNSTSTLFVDNKAFTEIWHFVRDGSEWMLDEIEQVEAETAIEKGYTPRNDKSSEEYQAAAMQQFAQHNNFFYNADFGWLLLPLKGMIFSLSRFGSSDINYHVIGKYHDMLVQFYQYKPIVQDKLYIRDYLKSFYKPGYRYDTYTIAQATLPKSYGDIVVMRKNPFSLSLTPMGMSKVSLESVDFNKYYSVFATDTEKVTSLELLNPAYMEKLLAVPFKVSIEVVDNTLYLYSTDKGSDVDTMLALLQNAFEEMKL